MDAGILSYYTFKVSIPFNQGGNSYVAMDAELNTKEVKSQSLLIRGVILTVLMAITFIKN